MTSTPGGCLLMARQQDHIMNLQLNVNVKVSSICYKTWNRAHSRGFSIVTSVLCADSFDCLLHWEAGANKTGRKEWKSGEEAQSQRNSLGGFSRSKFPGNPPYGIVPMTSTSLGSNERQVAGDLGHSLTNNFQYERQTMEIITATKYVFRFPSRI